MTVCVLLAVTIGWGALAFGAVYPWAYPPLLVMAALSGGAGWMTADSPRPARTLVGATLVTLGAIAVQLVPLEAGTIQYLTPGTDRLLRQLDIGYAAGSSSSAGLLTRSASHPR